MIRLFSTPWERQGLSNDEAWARYVLEREAERAFTRSRVRAWLRGRGRARPASPRRDGCVPVEAVVGVTLPGGSARRGIPALPRKLRRAWVHLYLRGDAALGAPVGLLARADGWYLDGSLEALLRLELARARGVPSVRVSTTSDGPAPSAALRGAGRERCVVEESSAA